MEVYKALYTNKISKKKKSYSDGFLILKPNRMLQLCNECGSILSSGRLAGSVPNLDLYEEGILHVEGYYINLDGLAQDSEIPQCVRNIKAQVLSNVPAASLADAHASGSKTTQGPPSRPLPQSRPRNASLSFMPPSKRIITSRLEAIVDPNLSPSVTTASGEGHKHKHEHATQAREPNDTPKSRDEAQESICLAPNGVRGLSGAPSHVSKEETRPPLDASSVRKRFKPFEPPKAVAKAHGSPEVLGICEAPAGVANNFIEPSFACGQFQLAVEDHATMRTGERSQLADGVAKASAARLTQSRADDGSRGTSVNRGWGALHTIPVDVRRLDDDGSPLHRKGDDGLSSRDAKCDHYPESPTDRMWGGEDMDSAQDLSHRRAPAVSPSVRRIFSTAADESSLQVHEGEGRDGTNDDHDATVSGRFLGYEKRRVPQREWDAWGDEAEPLSSYSSDMGTTSFQSPRRSWGGACVGRTCADGNAYDGPDPGRVAVAHVMDDEKGSGEGGVRQARRPSRIEPTGGEPVPVWGGNICYPSTAGLQNGVQDPLGSGVAMLRGSAERLIHRECSGAASAASAEDREPPERRTDDDILALLGDTDESDEDVRSRPVNAAHPSDHWHHHAKTLSNAVARGKRSRVESGCAWDELDEEGEESLHLSSTTGRGRCSIGKDKRISELNWNMDLVEGNKVSEALAKAPSSVLSMTKDRARGDGDRDDPLSAADPRNTGGATRAFQVTEREGLGPYDRHNGQRKMHPTDALGGVWRESGINRWGAGSNRSDAGATTHDGNNRVESKIMDSKSSDSCSMPRDAVVGGHSGWLSRVQRRQGGDECAAAAAAGQTKPMEDAEGGAGLGEGEEEEDEGPWGTHEAYRGRGITFSFSFPDMDVGDERACPEARISQEDTCEEAEDTLFRM